MKISKQFEDYLCDICGHKTRLPRNSKNPRCPKCCSFLTKQFKRKFDFKIAIAGFLR